MTASLWSEAGKALRALLAPRAETCLACGRFSRIGAELPLLCAQCAARVAWIVRPRCPVCGRAHGCPDCLRPDSLRRDFVLNRSAALYDAQMREWIAEYKYRGRELFAEPFAAMLEQAYLRMCRELSRAPAGSWLHGAAYGACGFNTSAERPDSAAGQYQAAGHPLRDPAFSRTRPSTGLPMKSFFSGSSARPSAWSADLITWVPVSLERLRERGFNQAELAARSLSRRIGVPACDLLARNLHTVKQSSRNRAERLRNLDGAFSLIPNLDPGGFKKWDLIGKKKGPGGSFPIRLLLVDDIYTTGSTAALCASALKDLQNLAGVPVSIYVLTLARS
ncbi:hypothetical protein QWJ34_20160 [Saccharibacillus sp. CPCC 101409]|uniref:ComF family protein n=1 Tax=Saccharibacillus sp. CPCC 101409 TaxID=3058041 RepID=UPI002670DDA5|nr:hypothetical protein [Saccharibacillus sp. CPCC 101409]MDO3412088.1 hypothetical protein [Saccharibacillus sp. CPCC 101409]